MKYIKFTPSDDSDIGIRKLVFHELLIKFRGGYRGEPWSNGSPEKIAPPANTLGGSYGKGKEKSELAHP